MQLRQVLIQMEMLLVPEVQVNNLLTLLLMVKVLDTLAEAAADFDRRRTERGSALEEALFNLAVQRLGDYGVYAGSRFENVLGASESRAARAAEIREALS